MSERSRRAATHLRWRHAWIVNIAARSRATAVLGVIGLTVGLLLVWIGLRPGTPAAAPLPDAAYSINAGAQASSGSPVVTPQLAPLRLSIPSLEVEARIVDRPVASGGDLVIPGDPQVVGRWDGGASLSATAGTTLLAGHVDLAGDLGALHALARLDQRAHIFTSDASGTVTAWAVSSMQVRTKDDLPTFATSGARKLALVTCGGPALRENGRWTYRDNVIVTAVPLTGR